MDRVCHRTGRVTVTRTGRGLKVKLVSLALH